MEYGYSIRTIDLNPFKKPNYLWITDSELVL